MQVEIRCPDLGEGVESAQVVSVLVAVGQQVQIDQAIVELETEKAVAEVPSPQAGRVGAIHVKPGDPITGGTLVLTLEVSESRQVPAPPAAQPKVEQAPLEQPSTAATPPAQRPVPESPPPAVAASGAAGDIPAGPDTRRLARELGVDLATVKGTGKDGRIQRQDVQAAARATIQHSQASPVAQGEPSVTGATAGFFSSRARAPVPVSTAAGESSRGTRDSISRVTEGLPAQGVKPPGEPAASDQPKLAPSEGPFGEGQDAYGRIRREPLSMFRKTIAVKMSKSASAIPHVTNFDSADVTELEAFRQAQKAKFAADGVKLTLLPFVVRAAAEALKMHPTVNAALDLQEGAIVYKEYVNIGIAVDTQRGLVAPVLRDAHCMSIVEIAKGLAAIAEKARAGAFALNELRGGTFTISNLGSIGGQFSTPIINYPESAVLLLGKARKAPVVLNDQVAVRLVLPISLSYDHRLIDGAQAARFLNDLIAHLESPAKLLLD